MAEKETYMQSVVFDAETRDQLSIMAKMDDRTNSALIRVLIRQEYARRNAETQPVEREVVSDSAVVS